MKHFYHTHNLSLATRNSRAFTLVEMLIVIVIIGILATALIPRLTGVRERAYDINMEKSVRDLQQALMLYHIDHGAYPGGKTDPYECGLGSTNIHCRHYATNCNNAHTPMTERRQYLMQDISPYINETFDMTQRERPYCLYYMTDSQGGCPSSGGKKYHIVFATKATTFNQYEPYITQGEGNTKARYCAYPLE